MDVYGSRPIATGLTGSGATVTTATYIRFLMRPENSPPRAPMDFLALFRGCTLLRCTTSDLLHRSKIPSRFAVSDEPTL